MPHDLDLIFTLTGGLGAALFFGLLAQKCRLSPIVGYLIAGVAVGGFTPGFVADHALAAQCAEIGVILLMFGVGLHFHLEDLLAVKHVALPGALAQIAVSTGLGAVVAHAFGWSWSAGIVFGMAVSVASTVVLTRVLSEARALHTRTGHIAIGWLIVEDIFTVLVLVLLPVIFQTPDAAAAAGTAAAPPAGHGIAVTILIVAAKLAALIVFTLLGGKYLLPAILDYVSRTRSRELFTLTVLVLALGLAVGSAKFFGASMALGAFLAGMVVGQSDYSTRAASEALPMRDAFAVLFFVSVGMIFDFQGALAHWPLVLATLGIILIGKPLTALVVVALLKRPLRSALSIAIALSQIGEFSFILATLGVQLKLLPTEAQNALVAASIVSITINPLLYSAVGRIARWVEKIFPPQAVELPAEATLPARDHVESNIIIIGYGPIGQTLHRILHENEIHTVVIEMNLETVRQLRADGFGAVYGDATRSETLHQAGVETARTLILTASGLPGDAIVKAARALNPKLRVLARTTYLRETPALKAAGANTVFSGEGEIALSMAEHLLRQLRATNEQVDRERQRIHRELL